MRDDAICPVTWFIPCPTTNLLFSSSSYTSPPQVCFSLLLLADLRNWDKVGGGSEGRRDMAGPGP